MAATGQFVQERIPVPLSVPETARMLLELVASADGSVAEQAGPMTWRVVRRYRPTWATVLAFLIVPLLLRRTDVCRAAVVEGRLGSEILIEGDIDPDLYDSLRALSRTPDAVRMSTMGARPQPPGLGNRAGPHGGPAPAPGYYGTAPAYDAGGDGMSWATSNPQAAPPDPFAAAPAALRLAEPVGQSLPPVPAPAWPLAPPASAPAPGYDAPPYAVPQARPAGNGAPQPVDVRALRDQSPFEPALQPGGGHLSENGRLLNGHNPAPDTTAMTPPPQPLPRVEVAIDTGEQAIVPGLLLVGRAPTPAGGDDGAGLLPVNDPSLSVSKTHLAVGVDRSGVWVQDRNSTNGSWLDEGVGQLRRLEPGVRTPVPPGTRVMIGERVLTLTRR
jgi:hypothetical protein